MSDLGTQAEIVHRYLAGEPMQRIAAELGFSYSVVQRQLHLAGVAVRSSVAGRAEGLRAARPAVRTAILAGSPLGSLVRELVRPGFRSLHGDAEDHRVGLWFGGGAGRLSKRTATSGAVLRRLLARTIENEGGCALTVNQEGGRLDALDWPDVTTLPGAMAIGATDDPRLAEQAGAAVGRQLRALGVTWNLAPVCDLYHLNPAVGTRSFGDDPGRVAVLATAYVRGLQSVGVAATAKHFPGLGGASGDPHRGVSTLDRLPEGALQPFAAAIEAGAAAVMVGSHVVTDLDDASAVFSPAIVQGLLRDRLGFVGVIVTENLSIPAVTRQAGSIGEAAVRAMLAGADLLMVDSEISRSTSPGAIRRANTMTGMRRAAVIAAVVEAVESGRLSQERVVESAGRVRALTRRFGVDDRAALLDDDGYEVVDRAAAATARRLARSAVTVVRDDERLLPLRPAAADLLGVVRMPPAGRLRADSSWQTPFTLPDLLRRHHGQIQVIDLSAVCGGPPLLPCPFAAVVVVTHNACHSGSNHRRVIAGFEAAGVPTVHLATGDPADLDGTPAQVAVATYSPYEASVAAAVEVLFGVRRPRGAVPVEWGRR
ncbi:glycoside hydrolase family 3 N-terminal domain-containing protein [Solwaraspora sp. WMMD1047]|uniref:glycoside hydrolase family 3 N-terminal domain-containing protein n=1 Tax=Solwaraspora sp. WMMD1047 TaxID=3016102 RepID=UPI002415B377|nr:glycoside hydrolase family 3 N-terminal domain-containing protein [Solwaraspora sp. WMMD1047]MDG4832993.1 glycoside hydrolase family 3 N-terminal domain-containing protein [Solwaraspora sp. WMMD1047]